MNTTREQRCERCGEKLKSERIVWLELSNTDGFYYECEKIPEGHTSQGGFPFGRECAKAELEVTKSRKEEIVKRMALKGLAK